MRRSNSRAALVRSNSARSMTSNAESNAARSAAAAAASALAAANRRRTSGEVVPPPGTLQRRGSVSSIRSNTTTTSTRPGQYSAVRQTGSRRLYGSVSTATPTVSAPSTTQNAGPGASKPTQLRETMRSKPPQAASSQRRQQNMPSNASIRSFQSDLERINEDYNKTYAYTGQTSAAAMRLAAPTSARGRRAESVISSAMSDSSEAVPNDLAQRRKASRVSFSDIDENEIHSRNPSPNPEKKRSALKTPVKSDAGSIAPRASPAGLMPPPALVRRASNSSITSNTSVGRGFASGILPPLQKHTQPVPVQNDAEAEKELSTIESNSAYSDADEDFKPSPALPRHDAMSAMTTESTMPLTQQNLAAVGGSPSHGNSEAMDGPVNGKSPLRSAMKKSSQAGSERYGRLETDSQMDGADDESEDSFAQRRRAKKIGGRKSLTTLRGMEPGTKDVAQGARTNGIQRSSSISSQQSRTSQGPSRMVSLRQNEPQQRRQSLQTVAPALSRRTSAQSITSKQPPLPPKSARRSSVAGSIAESVRSDAVSQHVAVMELAHQRVQRMLHPDVEATPEPVSSVYADAAERKRSSFERRRPSALSRQNSSSSMIDRSFRTSVQPEPVETSAAVQTHRRAASDDRSFATTLRGQRAKPAPAPRSSSMFLPGSNTDTQSMPATPRKNGRRMSFGFNRKRINDGEVPPVPTARKYSSDSETGRPFTTRGGGGGGSAAAAPKSALSAGTLRATAPRAASRPVAVRHSSDTSYAGKTSKPKKFQALRRFFKMRAQ